MSEKRCKNCRYWDCNSGDCNSGYVDIALCGTTIKPPKDFGCVCWELKESIQEHLARFLFDLWRDWLKSRMDFENISEGLWKGFLENADTILEIVEKGEGDE